MHGTSRVNAVPTEWEVLTFYTFVRRSLFLESFKFKIMFDIRIFIENDDGLFDNEVFLDVKLPFVPRVGEFILLSKDEYTILENQAKKSKKIALAYFPKWFGGFTKKQKNEGVKFKDEYIKRLNFEDAAVIKQVQYETGCKFVSIELSW